jgi:antibiotic biosynthesis monooxygenase (ABM) superfamily enzyme
LEVRTSTGSAAIVQQVPPAAVDRFMDWQRGVTTAAEGFTGYQGTEVYPPASGQPDAWVTVIHFDDEAALEQWLGSPLRAQWVDKLHAQVGKFELRKLSGGFGLWFAGLPKGAGELPPSWKMALTVLCGLYPTVMLLTIFVGPYTSPLGLAVSMLIGNALSVSILQWCVMPTLMAVLGPWLNANAVSNRLRSAGGLAALVLLLAAATWLFRQVTG